MSSLLRSSKFVRHFISLARNVVISTRPDIDVSLLQKSQNLVGVCSSNFSTTLIQLRGAQSNLDQTVRRLDEDARRTGRISLKEVEETLIEIKRLKKASTSQSLMVIRCCGNLVPEESPERRTQLVEEIWSTLEKLGVSLDISHYNALLKVYLENEHTFSPTEFLAKLEKQGIEPNRVTYQRLVSGYCQVGDIAGATKILEYMKEKQIPVSEGVFNALILGHSQADDMKSAEGILSVMKQGSLEPSSETYTVLLCGYARLGDKEAVQRLITECKLKDVLLADRDILEVAYAASVNNQEQLLDDILSNIRHMIGYNQDAVNTLLRLMAKGKDDAAYKVFQTLQAPVKTDSGPNMSGHILIKQLVKMNRPVEDILKLADRLERDGHTTYSISIALENCFISGHVELTMNLLKILKEKGEPLRNHYFWPSLATVGKSGNGNGSIVILQSMVKDFGVDVSSETVKDYYLPYCKLKHTDDILRALIEAGVKRSQAVKALLLYLVNKSNLQDAINLSLQHGKINLKSAVTNRQLAEALYTTKDLQSVVELVHIISNNSSERTLDDEEGEREEWEGSDDFPGRFLLSVVLNSETRGLIADVLKEMVKRGLSISSKNAESVQSYLHGDKLTPEISELLAQLSSGELTPQPLKTTSSPVGGVTSYRNASSLENLKEKFIANKEPQEKIINIYRQVFTAYSYEDDLENALRTKQEWEDRIKEEVPLGWWVQLLKLHCDREDIEKAKECWDKIKQINSDGGLDSDKTINYAKLYLLKDQMDEAINIVKNSKPRELRTSDFQNRNACFQLLTFVAEKTKDPEQVKKFLQILVDNKYTEVNNVNLGPVMKAHILRDDLEGALKEFEYCVKMYRQTPWKNELTTKFIEKEDAENLQTLVDLSTQVHGEINSLYDLVLSFVECGRIRQARKILETPGLRTRNARINFACERYKNEGQVAPLEGLVEATKDLPHIDRSEIYQNLLESYCQTDNSEKALGLWTQMQDEDVQVSDEFLIKLGNYLRSKGLSVPFTIPKPVAQSRDSKVNNRKEDFQIRKTEQSPLQSGIKTATARKDVDKCFQIIEQLKKEGKSLTRNENTMVIELLVQENKFKEATDLLTSLDDSKLPFLKTLNFLIVKLCSDGELDLLKQIGDKLPEDLKKMTSFVNRYLSCAVTAGKTKEELDKMEKQIDDASTPEEIDRLAETFPRGGIFALLHSSPSNYEPVNRIADKYYNKGVSAPINCLCMFHLGEGETDKARDIYQRYNLANSSRIMFQNVLKKARTTENPKLLDDLISLVKDSPSMTPEAYGLLYSNIVNINVHKGDHKVALSKLEEGLKVSTIEHFQRGTLLSLKEKLEAENVPFEYTIPERRRETASSTTSSSSSDEEPKKVAVKH